MFGHEMEESKTNRVKIDDVHEGKHCFKQKKTRKNFKKNSKKNILKNFKKKIFF